MLGPIQAALTNFFCKGSDNEYILRNIYLFIWLYGVLVAAHASLVEACRLAAVCVGSSSVTRDRIQAPLLH